MIGAGEAVVVELDPDLLAFKALLVEDRLQLSRRVNSLGVIPDADVG